jgi:hypothetical protein
VTIAATLGTLVGAAPLDRHRDREDQGRDLADRPRDATPVYWSTSGGSPHVRPIEPNHSATNSPDDIMIEMPKNACIAMTPISVSSRNG